MMMINIKFNLRNNKYNNLFISGHAMFNSSGKDIVCAGVSSIVFGIVNALEENKFTGKIIVDESNNSIEIKDIPNIEKFQTIINTMHIQLATIANDYSKYVKIEINK